MSSPSVSGGGVSSTDAIGARVGRNPGRHCPGGKGSNQAVAAARLGGRVSFISKLGRDPFGDLARATYKTEGIDTRAALVFAAL